MPIIYDGRLEKCHELPFYVTADNQTFVYEDDILELICEGNLDSYREQFIASPNFHLYEENREGRKIFPLIAFINECVNIYDHYVQANVEKTREMTDSLEHISERVYPVVLAIAKIGAKVQFGEMKPGETPATIFEREMSRLIQE